MRRLIALFLILGLLPALAQRRERLRNDESRRAGAAAIAAHSSSYQSRVTLAGGRTVDLSATLRRIAGGKSLAEAGLPNHAGDGTVFLNLTDRSAGRRPLPDKPRGYYVEYVHPPRNGVRWPGPERLIVGRGGEAYYSPDHYDPRTIVALRIENR